MIERYILVNGKEDKEYFQNGNDNALDECYRFAEKWISEHKPHLHLIRPIIGTCGELVCAVLVKTDDGKMRRHPAVHIPGVKFVEDDTDIIFGKYW